MPINTDQLLNRPSELHRRYGGRLAMQKAQQEKMVGGASVNIVLTKKSIKNVDIIKTNVVKIESFFKGTLALDKKQLDDKKRDASKKRKEKIETKLETKPNAEGGKVSMPKLPGMGILDFVKNFIGNVLLGYFAVRLIKHLPKIMPIVKFLGNAADFIIDVGGKLLTGLVSFIDAGYKAYDATRGFIKNIGGENFAKGFDKFLGAIDTALFLTTALAGSMALEAMSGGDGGVGPGGGKPGGKPNVINKGFWNERTGRWQGSFRGRDGEYRTNEAARRYTQRFGRDAATSRFGKEGLDTLGGKYARSGATNLARKGLVGLAGKGGAKAVLGAVRPLLKRLPIIGALIDFGLSVALGEDPGRAAFKAIGAGLLGSFGAAIGSVVPIAGNIVGGIIGGIAGDALGAALYDIFFGNKKPQQKNQKIQKKEGGGLTRGGKSQRGARRTISKGKYKRVLAPQKPTKTELKSKAFTKPENKILKESTEQLDKTKYFGPILAISSKIMNKEEPTQRDYQNVGLGINMLISQGVQQQQLKGGIVAAFAGGGLVDPDVLSAAETGGDISNWVAKTFRGEVESNAQKTLRMIREKKDKKESEVSATAAASGDEEGAGSGGIIMGTSFDNGLAKLLKSYEGLRTAAYKDAKGIPTIGMGATYYPPGFRLSGRVQMGQTITEDEALMIKMKHIAEHRNRLLRDISSAEYVKIPDNVKAALESKVFNYGSLGPTLAGLVKDGIKTNNYQSVADYFRNTLAKHDGGLNSWRRNDEAGLIESGVSQRSKVSFPKSSGGQAVAEYKERGGRSTEGFELGDGKNVQSISHPDTGSGYTIAGLKDQQGRPVVFSRVGASAFSRMMSDSKGAVKGSDIASSQRSPRKNKEVGGASNSNHLYGNALDIHGPSQTWMRRNGKKYGWNINDYSGSHGGHFDFKGSSMTLPAAYAKGGETLDGPHLAMVGEEGREIVIDNDSVESHPEVRQMLLAINQASNYQGVLNAIRQYAPYDAMSPQTIIVPTQGSDEGEYDSGMSGGGVAFLPIGEGGNDPFATLYQGG